MVSTGCHFRLITGYAYRMPRSTCSLLSPICRESTCTTFPTPRRYPQTSPPTIPRDSKTRTRLERLPFEGWGAIRSFLTLVFESQLFPFPCWPGGNTTLGAPVGAGLGLGRASEEVWKPCRNLSSVWTPLGVDLEPVWGPKLGLKSIRNPACLVFTWMLK